MSMNAPKKYVKPVVDCSADKGRTKQSFAKSCDINAIVARYQRTGMMDHVRENPGIFADVSNIVDYPGMVSKIRFAQESFDQLSAGLRSRFDHDPAKLIAFVSDSANRDEAIKLGIIPKPKDAPEAKVSIPVKGISDVKEVKAEEPKVPSKAEPKA